MAERAIVDGFVDCPKYGIIDEVRCLPSCEFHDEKDETRVICTFGEVPSADQPGVEQTEAAPA